MNHLLRHLEREGVPTVIRLRSLYRRLAMMAHPDSGQDTHERFVRLHESYEEALALLSVKEQRKGPMSPGDERTRALRSLYRYALRFNGNGAEQVFSELLEQVKSYRPETHADLKQYESVFRRTYMEWRNELYIYDAHHDWISAIVELARYLSDGWTGYRTIMERYLSGATGKAAQLDEEKRHALQRLSQWLAEEAEGPPVELIYE